MLSSQPLLDAAGRRRSPAFRTGIAPCNKGQRYPADPPTVGEIVAVMRQAGHTRHGHRLKALIVVLWRAGLRIHEALSLTETDLDQRRGSILVRQGLCRIRHNPGKVGIIRRSSGGPLCDLAKIGSYDAGVVAQRAGRTDDANSCRPRSWSVRAGRALRAWRPSSAWSICPGAR